LSQTLSSSGSATQAVGQAWLVVQLHGGGVALGVVTAAVFAPTLVLSAAMSSVADRWDRRRVLVATQCLQIGLATALALVTMAGATTIPLLVGFALALGTVFAVDAPSRQVYVLELVTGEKLSSAISLNEVVLNASRVIGPGMAGAILAVGPVWICFAANAASFVPTLAVLLTQRSRARAIEPSRPQPGHLRAGVRYAFGQGPIRSTLLMAVTAGGIYNLAVVMPLMAKHVFHVDGGDYGLMLAAFGIGAVPGALVSAAGHAMPSGRSVRTLGLLSGLAVVACSRAPTFVSMLVGLAVVGAVSIWFIARANAYVLLTTEESMRGRVMGVWSTAIPGMNPITGLIVGSAAAGLGPRAAYTGVGLAATAAALLGWRALAPRRRDAPLPTDEPQAGHPSTR
jgi:MFS family permease